MNLKRGSYIVIGALGTCVALGGAVALGQSTGSPGASPSPTASSSPASSPAPSGSPSVQPAAVDIESIRAAEALNYINYVDSLELQRGNAAQPNVQGAQAKALAQALVTDSQDSATQVSQLASQKGITLAPYQEAGFESAVDSLLAQLSGPEYDQTFLDTQLEYNRGVLQKLQTSLNTVTDPDIQSLISQTIPVVQQHIDLASGAVTAPSPTVSPSGGASPAVSPSPGPSASPSISPSPFA